MTGFINLYRYEADLAYFCHQLGKRKDEQLWLARSRRRAEMIDKLMWDKEDGLYYDYDFFARKRKRIRSLATFFPLFCGLTGGQTPLE